jgi:hypothetical protein
MKVEKSLIVVPRNLAGEDKQTLFQLIDVEDSLHFELLWTGTDWIDCPGESIEQAIISGVPNIQDWTTAADDWTEAFFPGSLASRFNDKQQAAIDDFMKLEISERVVQIAKVIHEGETDPMGRDFIGHIRRTYENLEQTPAFAEFDIFDQIFTRLATWLSRTLEREASPTWPKVLPSDLAEWGASRDILSAVEFLTRDTTLMEYLGKQRDVTEFNRSIASNPLARAIRIAQIADEANRQREIWREQIGGSIDIESLEAQIIAFSLSEDEELWLGGRISDSCEVSTGAFDDDENEAWKKDFSLKFGELFDVMSREPLEQASKFIELVYFDFKRILDTNYASSKESFNSFRATASRYLLYKEDKETVLRILSDVLTPNEFESPPVNETDRELSNLLSAATTWSNTGPIPWFEEQLEDFPPIPKEQQDDK